MLHWILIALYDIGKGVAIFIVGHWLVEHGFSWAGRALTRTEKRLAILEHMIAKVLKEGHLLPLGKCQEGKCHLIAG